jgi:hypothetical protein
MVAPLAAEDVRRLGSAGFVYGLPLVLMDVTREVVSSRPKAAPINALQHARKLPSASFTDVVSPNADTLYSTAWLDLGVEPVILGVPDTAGRYYLMQLLDAWTNVFACPGTRTTGTGAGRFAIIGPRWQGALPAEIQVLRSPTEMVWLIGRTETRGKDDYEAVYAMQDQYQLAPLSGPAPAVTVPDADEEPEVDSSEPEPKRSPNELVASMDASTFLGRLARLLVANPPADADAPMLERLRTLGVVAGELFEPEAAQVPLLDRAIKRALDSLFAALRGPQQGLINGWRIFRDLGDYGTDYTRRALIALVGLGANLNADAVYPTSRVDADGQPLSGSRRYVLHFNAGALPPVRAFWSLTMYQNQRFVANPLDRYAIGDRDPLIDNADGSLDLLVQQETPGPAREANWLPAPAGDFEVMLRLYWPEAAIIDGTWQPPPLQRVG